MWHATANDRSPSHHYPVSGPGSKPFAHLGRCLVPAAPGLAVLWRSVFEAPLVTGVRAESQSSVCVADGQRLEWWLARVLLKRIREVPGVVYVD